MQLDRITELVESGKDEGAEIYQPPCRLPEKGYWFAPTVFTNVAQSYRIAQEEIFGPVLSVLTFRTPEEAVEKANNTPYGLSAGVWTEKGSRILWMAERLRAGVVWANTFNRFDPASPFGGYKESGFGREGGRHGLEPYLRFDGVKRFRLPLLLRRAARRARRSAIAASGALSEQAAAGQEDLQALRRRRASRAPSPAARTRPRARTSRAPRARTRATPSSRRARRSPAGRPRPRTTAARCSTGSRR